MTVPQQPSYPAQGPVPQQPAPPPMYYSPPAPSAYSPPNSWWREKMPFGPVPFTLAVVGVLTLCVALLGPAAVYTRIYEDYQEIYDIPIFGSYYSFPDYTSLSNLDILPILLTLMLLVVTFAATAGRRLAAKVGTMAMGVVALAFLVSQVLNWKALLLETNHRTEGLAPEPEPSDTFDPDDGDALGETVAFGWGAILLILALLLLISAAATTFDRKPEPGLPPGAPQGPYSVSGQTGSFPQIPQQPAPGDPMGLTVTTDPPPQHGQWQQARQGPPPHQP
ncbi:hypothetical protein AB0I28_07630 [Phytomonospora sp. NPDC050363]|uniref:hypothetical protein n=1 Tax=Phytomonospora sp. NPDC050363 TaxID=3155642 RepID=UPI0034069598